MPKGPGQACLRQTVRRWTFAVHSVLLAAATGCKSQPAALVFEEYASVTLPVQETALGGSVRGDTLLYWTAQGQLIEWEPNRGAIGILQAGRLHSAAITDSGVVALVSGGSRLLRSQGRSLHISTLPDSMGPDVDAATFSHGAWVFTTLHETGGAKVLRKHGDSVEVLLTSDRSMGVSSRGKTLLVYSVGAPFWIRRLESSWSEPVVHDIEMEGKGVGLAVLPLNQGEWLRTFADLSTDRRDVVRLSDRFDVLERRSIDAPFGFLASDTSNQVAVGALDIQDTQLLFYRWRFVGPGAP